LIVLVAAVWAVYWSLNAAQWSFVNLWLTPGQQGQRLFDQGHYAEAAERFQDSQRRAAAFYLDGQFKSAAASYGRSDTAESVFNRGNALVMQGKYDEAIKSYDWALQLKPGWQRAVDNRIIAQARKKMLEPPEDDYGGTGGKLEADEIVFDDRAKKSGGGSEEVIQESSQTSDEELRAIWLRQVRTKPADFLRAKFAYQYSRENSDQ
jgi:Ca-activated chloride channel family protein